MIKLRWHLKFMIENKIPANITKEDGYSFLNCLGIDGVWMKFPEDTNSVVINNWMNENKCDGENQKYSIIK